MKLGSAGAERVIFFEWTEEVSSVRVTNRRGDKFLGSGLSDVAVVGFDDAAELLFAADASAELWPKGFVQYLVVHADTPVRTNGIVMPDPGPHDIVQLLLAEAHKVIE